MKVQLALPLEPREAFARENFVVGSTNANALAFCRILARLARSAVAVLHGPCGARQIASGRHLAAAVRRAARFREADLGPGNCRPKARLSLKMWIQRRAKKLAQAHCSLRWSARSLRRLFFSRAANRRPYGPAHFPTLHRDSLHCQISGCGFRMMPSCWELHANCSRTVN